VAYAANVGARLAVPSGARVLELNADKVDGVDFDTGRTRVIGAYSQ
jgi:hypothetical protein